MRRLLCRWFGHRWRDCEIRHEGGWLEMVGMRVPVTWACDETCARCGAESWWPS